MHMHPFFVLTTLLLTFAVLAGCDGNKGAESPTQVAAKVNADEITVHQINNVLAQSKNIDPEVSAQVKRAILERLISQQLARQKAIEAQLDRSPKVVQDIESARTNILARAHLQGIASTLSKPGPQEVHAYYEKYPELFAQRRVFALEQLVFAADKDVIANVRKQLPKSRSLKEIANWLQSRNIKFSESQDVRAAEQIPLEILPKLQAMKEGDVELFDGPNGRSHLIQLRDFMAAPMDEATATPYIKQFLFNQALADATAREMSELRKQAKIEYLGEFARGAGKEKP